MVDDLPQISEIFLPSEDAGRLFRAPMPGRWDWPLGEAFKAIKALSIDLVVCLATMDEIEEFSPRYAALIEDEDLPWEWWDLPILDRSLPEDEEEFFDLARDLAEELRGGANVLIHCLNGVGRSGLLAMAVLLALGIPLESARAAVTEAGAGPETYQQERLIERAARALLEDEDY